MWVGGLSGGTPDDTHLSEDVILPLAQIQLLGRSSGRLSYRIGKLSCGYALTSALWHLLCNSRLRLLPLYTLRYFAVWFPRIHSTVAVPAGYSIHRRVGSHHVLTQRVAYQQLPCVWPKRWQRLPFGTTYVSTDTRKLQISVSYDTFYTSNNCATDTMEWGVGGQYLAGS